ncbi:hypothetical protein J7L87_01985 [bacterium]|nr:hypothetical protein [bacterium]
MANEEKKQEEVENKDKKWRNIFLWIGAVIISIILIFLGIELLKLLLETINASLEWSNVVYNLGVMGISGGIICYLARILKEISEISHWE